MGRFLTDYLRRDGRDSETVSAKLPQDSSVQVGACVAALAPPAPPEHAGQGEPAAAACCWGWAHGVLVQAAQAQALFWGDMRCHPPHRLVQPPFALVNTTVALTAADVAAGK